MPASLPRTLHRVSHGTRDAARATIRHLSLSRYQQGRRAAQEMLRAAGEPVTPAVAAAAAAPPLPWGLLAATPSLTSLDMRGDQLEALMEGGGGAAAAAVPAPAAASSAAAATSSVAAAAAAAASMPHVLATIPGRLRCLRVEWAWGCNEPHGLAHLGRLLAGATQLTQLVLEADFVARLDCRPLLDALEASQQGTAAAGAAAGGAATTPAAGDHGTSTGGALPPLRRLKLRGQFPGLLSAWFNHPQAAGQLTALHLDSGPDVEELQGLSACSGLRELVGGSYAWNLPLPTDATRLSALTYLRLFGDVVPPVVWELTTLRRLELCGGEGAWDIPDSLSNLRQLRVLRISGEATEELPAELGTWLPHLEELLVSDTAIRSLPPGLTRVTYLSASAIHQVSEVTHLAALNRLELDTYYLEPPLQPLSQLTALKALSLGLYEDGEEPQQCMLAPLPSLRSLEVRGWKPLQVAQVQGVVVSAQQLTRLCIEVSLAPEEVARLGQVGVLPQLQQLQLGHMPIDSKHDFAHWDASAAIPWLQQQPRLTSLTLVGCPVPGLLLQQLPPQLEELDIRQGAWLTDPPPTVAQLSRLRKLALSVEKHLPAWVSNLSSLEELRVSGWQVAGDWQVLAQLPVLRRVELPQPVKAQALCHAPHSCWSVLVPGAPPNRSVFDD